MSTLNSSDGLEYGQDYTFTFKLSSLETIQSTDVEAAVSQLQDLGSPNVVESLIGPATLTGGQWDVQFTFVGDDTTATVQSVADEISSAVASIHWFGTSFSFVLAQTDFVQTSAANLNQAIGTLANGSGGTNVDTNPPDYTTYAVIGVAVIVAFAVVLKFS